MLTFSSLSLSILSTVPDIKTDPSSTVSTADLPMELEKLSCAAGQSCQCVRKHEGRSEMTLLNLSLFHPSFIYPSSILHLSFIYLSFISSFSSSLFFYRQCCDVTQEVVMQVTASNRWTLLLLPPCPVPVVHVDDIYTRRDVHLHTPTQLTTVFKPYTKLSLSSE